MPALKRHHTIPEARATLQHLLMFHTVRDIVDQLASLCAENAEAAEPIDSRCATQWDRSCGKLAVCANQLLN